MKVLITINGVPEDERLHERIVAAVQGRLGEGLQVGPTEYIWPDNIEEVADGQPHQTTKGLWLP